MLAAVPDPLGSVKQVLKQTWEPYKNCGHWTIGSHYRVTLQCLAHKYKNAFIFTVLKPAFLLIEKRCAGEKPLIRCAEGEMGHRDDKSN